MWPKIIQLLQSKGFSQAKLAEIVGVDQSTICRLGDGRAPEPRYSVGEMLIKLSNETDEQLAVRLAGPDEPPPRPQVMTDQQALPLSALSVARA